MRGKFLSRKFILSSGFAIVASTALLLGTISGGDFISLVTIILGIYNATNGGIKYIQAKSEKHIEE